MSPVKRALFPLPLMSRLPRQVWAVARSGNVTSVRVLRWRTSPAAWPKVGDGAGCLRLGSLFHASLVECKVWRITSRSTARWRPSTSPALFCPEGNLRKFPHFVPVGSRHCIVAVQWEELCMLMQTSLATDAVMPARRIVASGLRHLIGPARHQSRYRSDMSRTGLK